jgi:hypothetical protein
MRCPSASVRRRIWKILNPILLGMGLMVLFALLAGFAGGACHCVSPTGIFFPYTAIARGAFDWESIGDLLFVLQYPLYAVVVARARGGNFKGLAFLILMAVHFAAVILALRVYQHG